jgi:hypothetical protein
MTDTQRTKAELIALCADNTTGDITPQTLRDIIESCKVSRGAIHYDDVATLLNITTQNVFVPVNNTSVLQPGAYRFTSPSDGRLQYDDTPSVIVRVIGSISVSSTANNQVVKAALGVNGTPLTASFARAKVTTGGDVVTLCVVADVLLNSGDYIGLFAMNETSSSDFNIEHAYLSAVGHLT